MDTNEQIEICRKCGAEYQPLDVGLKLGISENFFSGMMPLNGLRHPPEHGTCGWYLWAGEELSEAGDFFKPMHVYHLVERCPRVVKYLALPAVGASLSPGIMKMCGLMPSCSKCKL